ncbi:hypothetical protein EVA_08214 [gut metagenome]|uniref:Uncharacterized protein n=1 Tax=gut metagenome TaxID=749906 RepID=J9GN21_9ZZZZ
MPDEEFSPCFQAQYPHDKGGNTHSATADGNPSDKEP